MFDDLQAVWITELYKSYKGILIPSMKNQLSTSGLFLDLDSLPLKPYPFKELFIRWLIFINKDRIKYNQPIFINAAIIHTCPLWRIVKCPIKKITLTKEGLFGKPTSPVGSIGTIGTNKTIGTFNK